MIRVLFIILLFSTNAFAMSPVTIGGSSGGATDYTADANCMGAWLMNVDSTTETDRSVSSADLTEVSGTIETSADVPAGYSGTSRTVVIGDTEWLQDEDGGSTDINGADQSLSLCIWVKYASDPGADDNLFTKFTSVGDQRQYRLANDHSTSKMYFRVSTSSASGAGYVEVLSDTDMAASASWQHVCAVSNDIDLRIYLNGALDCTPEAHTAGIFNGSDPLKIGGAFSGQIDEAIIFDRELSAAEVLEIYTYGIDGSNGAND